MQIEGMNTLSLNKDDKDRNLLSSKSNSNDGNRKLFKNTLEQAMIRQDRLGKAAKDEIEINKVKLQNRIDEALNKVASFFGIGPTLMKSILQSLKMSPEDLIDENKREFVIKKLAKHFGLDEKQKDDLLELLKGC